MARSDEQYDRSVESSSALIGAYRSSLNDPDADRSLAVVHYRGGQTEYDLGAQYASSTDPLDRVTAADVLGQLGWSDSTHHNESVGILIRLLSDTDDSVVSSAATALGHRNDPSCIPHVLRLASHTNPDVRFGVVMALSRHDDIAAITGLIELARDRDRDVRNWATFGLGSMTEVDTPELRDALAGNLHDSDAEIRGEAMIGLARCRDVRAFPAVFEELSGPFYGSWCLEAAELLGDPRFLPLLGSLRDALSGDDRSRFSSDFVSAERACHR